MNKGMEAESNFQVVGGHGRQGSPESGGDSGRKRRLDRLLPKETKLSRWGGIHAGLFPSSAPLV